MGHIKFTDTQNSQEKKRFQGTSSLHFYWGSLKKEAESYSNFFYVYPIRRRRIPEVINSHHNDATFKPRKSKLLIVPYAHSKKI